MFYSAAVVDLNTGEIKTGKRHWQCLAQIEGIEDKDINDYTFGFLTSEGFKSRAEAALYALCVGIIDTMPADGELTSEHIWKIA